MSQIKIYALNKTIELHRIELSKAIHQALVKELNCPEKRFFNDLYLIESENFIYSKDRSRS